MAQAGMSKRERAAIPVLMFIWIIRRQKTGQVGRTPREPPVRAELSGAFRVICFNETISSGKKTVQSSVGGTVNERHYVFGKNSVQWNTGPSENIVNL
jgi:hypothetical protein